MKSGGSSSSSHANNGNGSNKSGSGITAAAAMAARTAVVLALAATAANKPALCTPQVSRLPDGLLDDIEHGCSQVSFVGAWVVFQQLLVL